MRRFAMAAALAGFLIVVGGCGEATAVEHRERVPIPTRQGDLIYGPGSSSDTILVEGELVFQFMDGNSLRFSSTGSSGGVIVSAKVNGVTSNISFSHSGQVAVSGQEFLSAANGIGFFGVTPTLQLTVTGDRSNGSALADLLSDLSDYGLVNDVTVP